MIFSSPPGAHADPAGKTTLQETLAPAPGAATWPKTGQGEKYVVRRGARPRRRGATAIAPLAGDFAQLTDPQIADEMSPGARRLRRSGGRRDQVLVAAAGGARAAGLRLRRAQRKRQPPSRPSRATASARELGFALTTGDLADNQQLNETRWFRTVLDGGTVDPFSGSDHAPMRHQPAGDARAHQRRRRRPRYTGIADYDDYRGAPADRYAGFWDPDEAAPTTARTRRSRATRA